MRQKKGEGRREKGEGRGERGDWKAATIGRG